MRLLLSHKSQIIAEAQIRKAVHAGRKFAFNSSVLDQAYPKEGTTAGALQHSYGTVDATSEYSHVAARVWCAWQCGLCLCGLGNTQV